MAPDTASQEVRKTVTVVFADVAGSTGLDERLDPESVRRIMHRVVWTLGTRARLLALDRRHDEARQAAERGVEPAFDTDAPTCRPSRSSSWRTSSRTRGGRRPRSRRPCEWPSRRATSSSPARHANALRAAASALGQ